MATLAQLEAGFGVLSWLDVRAQLQRHILARSEAALAAGDRVRDALASLADLEAHRARMREVFLASLGGLPDDATALAPRLTGTVAGAGFRIEKLIYTARPGVHITANLYLPAGVPGRTGAVLFLCGHNPMGKQTPAFQAACQRLVLAGLVVLAQDPIGQGERFSYQEVPGGFPSVAPSTIEHDYAGSQCLPLGDGLARYFLHDARRGLDLLASRPEVDPARLGVTGYSGGGTQTAMLMLTDPRVAAAAPGVFIMDRASYLPTGGAQDAEQVWRGTTALGLDHEDLLLAMAPRPVLVLAAQWDFFPIEGTRRTVARARRLWELLGQGDRLRLVEDRSVHACSPALAAAAAAFFAEHLLGHAPGHVDEPTPFPAERLWCTASGQVRGEIPGARAVYEENLDRLAAAEAARSALDAGLRRRRLGAWLAGEVGRDRGVCPPNLRVINRAESLDELRVEAGWWWSQPGLANAGLLFRPGDRAGATLPVTVAVWDGGTTGLRPHLDWLRRTCAAGRAVLVLDTSGVGALAPQPQNPYPDDGFYGTIQRLNDDLLWLGDSLMALRIHDATRVLEALADWPGLTLAGAEAYAHGREGAYLVAAAALDRRFGRVDAVAVPPASAWVKARHYDSRAIRSLILPGLLRLGELDELASQSPQGPSP